MAFVRFLSDSTDDHRLLTAYLGMYLPETGQRLLELLDTEEGRSALPASPVTGSRIAVPSKASESGGVETLLMLGGLPNPMPGSEPASNVLAENVAQDQDDATSYAWPQTAGQAGRAWRLLVQQSPDEDGLRLTVTSLMADTEQLLETVVRGLDDAGLCQLVEAALLAEALRVDPAHMMALIQDHACSLEGDISPELVAAASSRTGDSMHR